MLVFDLLLATTHESKKILEFVEVMWLHVVSSTVEDVETHLAGMEPHDHPMTDRSVVITILYVEAEHEDHVG